MILRNPKLSREVCKKCCNVGRVVSYKGDGGTRVIPWDERDEEIWIKRGWVMCGIREGYHHVTAARAHVEKEPPEWCDYKMEHFIVNQ